MADPPAAAAAAAAPTAEVQEQDKEEEIKGQQLLAACQAGDSERVQALLAEGAPAYYQASKKG
jgi:hypothetical protein